jgi:SAM-dependent methyltransferase
VINDWKDTEILAAIPTNQFGLVFAYNYFNWKPIEIIERFLIEIYQKLRPGGALIFTYNECDNWYGVGAVENAWMCYTPGSRIQTIARNLGYKIIRTIFDSHFLIASVHLGSSSVMFGSYAWFVPPTITIALFPFFNDMMYAYPESCPSRILSFSVPTLFSLKCCTYE